MRLPTLATLTALFALAFAGCGQQPLEVAPAGAATAIHTAVGPIPGNGTPPLVRSYPYQGDAVAAAEGKKLFNWFNCSGCHGAYGGGGMGPSLRDPVWIYGGSPDHIFASISQGRSNGMPSWGTKIPEEQIWKIVTYIKTLNTPAEADPPRWPLREQVWQANINQSAPTQSANSTPAPQPPAQ